MNIHRFLGASLVVLSSLVLSACGGGGGDSGGPSVSITHHTSAIQVEAVEGMRMPEVIVNGNATGDLQSLSGKTVYVLVVDPDQLFEAATSFVASPNGQFSLTLSGKNLSRQGVFAGNIKLHACLDSECKNPLGNSPLSLPYSVTVLPGVLVDTTPIVISSPFGNQIPNRTLTVTLPRHLTTWNASVVDDFGSISNSFGLTYSGAGAEQTSTLTLSVIPMPPGNYRATLVIHAEVVTPTASGGTIEKLIDINYQVTENPSVLAVFSPSALTLSRIQGDILNAPVRFTFVPNNGVQIDSIRVEYLSAPAEAAGHQNLNSWLYTFPEFITSTCFNTIDSSDCLPAGTYTARIVYDVSGSGSSSQITLPVTLQIVTS